VRTVVGGILFAVFILLATLGCVALLIWSAEY
jgi:hypothetical protein